ncbi:MULTISPECIES: hypothetical protein [unclassified Streptomyces]|uniref:hypothetical protein n=1 Tax=unclassified Streptomyces TaxID=2593676 RepID=UPI002DD9EED1|nr:MULTISPECIES: hypothetical protein [unclassified Streptomyces]WSB80020.1 hypothetical protein OHB04_32715 [Streptomyces sp. NBC_01775]WSS11773.1 hypothetical protein OG533_07500 [Streptomyces sp. NBC_01186]WSS40485.1 hypothetical protein OG220_07645 [Streptomyces sp. NBC_01187]
MDEGQAGAGTGALNDVLKHSEVAKRHAARYIEHHLGPDVRAAGALAETETQAAAGPAAIPWAPGRSGPATFSPQAGLRGWEIQAGLTHREREWKHHQKQLEARLRGEMAALLDAGFVFGCQDTLTAHTLSGQAWGSPRPSVRSRLEDL